MSGRDSMGLSRVNQDFYDMSLELRTEENREIDSDPARAGEGKLRKDDENLNGKKKKGQAGGHGGIEFFGDEDVDSEIRGTMWKPTNAREIKFYKQYRENLGDNIPEYHGTEHPINKKAAGDGIHIGNMTSGMESPDVMDIKIGARTVSRGELLANNSSRIGANIKMAKLRATDRLTKSNDRGFRVVSYPGHPGGPRAIARLRTARENPQNVFSTFFGDNEEVENQRLQTAKKVQSIRNAFAEQKNLAFVGASVLVARDKGEVRVKMIDFAHMMEKNGENDDKVDKYHKLFIDGLDRLVEALSFGQKVSDENERNEEVPALEPEQEAVTPIVQHGANQMDEY